MIKCWPIGRERWGRNCPLERDDLGWWLPGEAQEEPRGVSFAGFANPLLKGDGSFVFFPLDFSFKCFTPAKAAVAIGSKVGVSWQCGGAP